MGHSMKAQQAKKPLNVILIIADDLGWTDLGIYGSDLHETPNLDKLALDNVRFGQFYAASPVCSPTRASILTGQYPARLHITTHFENSGDYAETSAFQNNRKLNKPVTVGNLPLDTITLANMFHDAGYFTAHLGKWHLGDFGYYPENHGFDINIGGTAWGAPDTYWYPFGGNNYQRQLRYIPGLELGSHEDSYLTDRLTDRALEVIDAKKEQPFFIHLAYYSPHTPIEAKPEWEDYFKTKVNDSMRHRNYIYAAMIASIDENVGRILDKLEEEELTDETIVIFISDNGGRIGSYPGWETVANNEPLRSGKGSLYEGGIRVPMIIRWPGVTGGGRMINAPTITCDLFPTILSMAGINGLDYQTDGMDLTPLIQGEKVGIDRESLYWHYPHYYSTTTPASSILQWPWKLIHYFENEGPSALELYNLADDLSEENNLADQQPDLVDSLYQQLRNWRNEVKAQLPSFNPEYQPKSW